jgi:hypothetical protein
MAAQYTRIDFYGIEREGRLWPVIQEHHGLETVMRFVYAPQNRVDGAARDSGLAGATDRTEGISRPFRLEPKGAEAPAMKEGEECA